AGHTLKITEKNPRLSPQGKDFILAGLKRKQIARNESQTGGAARVDGNLLRDFSIRADVKLARRGSASFQLIRNRRYWGRQHFRLLTGEAPCYARSTAIFDKRICRTSLRNTS